MKAALCALAILLAAHQATAHTYFKAELVPFGDQAPNATDSSALLDFYTHEDQIFWKLNVTDVSNASAVHIVFGDPEIAGDKVATLHAWATPFDGTDGLEGVFNASDFEQTYELWTTKTLGANGGLKFLWATLTNPAAYRNIVLSGPLEHYTPAGES